MEITLQKSKNDTFVPVNLLCDFTGGKNVPVINNSNPVFSWASKGNGASSLQSAFRIKLYEYNDSDNILWDSGKIISPDNCYRYSGPALKKHGKYTWKVTIWNNNENSGNYSSQATFITGSFNPKDNFKTAQSMVELNRILPNKLISTGRDSYFIDFGKDAFARLELTLETESPITLEIAVGEVLAGNNKLFVPKPQTHECGRRYRKLSLYLTPGRKTYKLEFPAPYLHDDYQIWGYNCREDVAIKCPEQIGELIPFRYCEITGYKKALAKTDVVQLAASYPFNDNAALFSSSDENLNRIWDFCKYTIKATSPFGVYIDGDRERQPYGGDCFINQLSHYCCDREYSLARNTLDYFFSVGTDWPFESILSIILVAYNDYLYTGNIDYCEKYYKNLQAMLFDEFARNDGILVTTEVNGEHPIFEKFRTRLKLLRDLIDWPKETRDDYDIGDVNTVANSFYFRALNAMGHISDALKKSKDSTKYRRKAECLKIAMHKCLYNPETGLFVDCEGSSHSSVQANLHAVSSGVASNQQIPRIIKFLDARGMRCGVWAAQFLLEAFYKAGKPDNALRLMTSKGKNSWFNMLKEGATMTMECWSMDLKNNLDWNHPWATAPVNIIARYLMGIRPLEPGFRKILIQPQPGDLQSASIRQPTIRGDINIAFTRDKHKFTLELTIPGNSTGKAVLPAVFNGNRIIKLLVNSAEVEYSVVNGNIVIDNIVPGGYKFILEF